MVASDLTLNIGLRSGINNIGRSHELSFADFNYATGRYTFGPHAFVAGGYYANRAFEGSGKNFGFMAGVKIELKPDVLNFIADFISGNSALGIINAGVEIELPYQWSISAGAQLPWPNSDNAYGAILQLSWN